jgi:hypothetical protein
MSVVDLSSWAPPLIAEELEDAAGYIISAEEWNALWNMHRTQGNEQSNTIKDVIDNLYETCWHPTDGASYITNPSMGDPDDVDDSIGTTVAAQLEGLWERWLEAKQLFNPGAAHLIPCTESELGDTVGDVLDAAQLVLASHTGSINTITSQINGIVAGELEQIPHNSLPNRDALAAHPVESIDGLSDELAAIEGVVTEYYNNVLAFINGITHNAIPDRDDPDCHPVASITYDVDNTLAEKIASMDAAIALATGVETVAHNTTTDRTASDCHPIAAITGLQTALDGKDTAIALKLSIATAGTTYQTKVRYGTGIPSNSLGVDGDVYIKYVL